MQLYEKLQLWEQFKAESQTESDTKVWVGCVKCHLGLDRRQPDPTTTLQMPTFSAMGKANDNQSFPMQSTKAAYKQQCSV